MAWTLYKLDTRLPVSNSEREIVNINPSIYGVVETETRFGIWNSETLNYDPYPIKKKPISRGAFMRRFTRQELEGIYTAAKQNVSAEVFVKLLEAYSDVELDDELLIEGMNEFIAFGILTAERVSEILRDE